jgi:hypothetical protein
MKIIYYAGVNIHIFVRKQYFLSALFPEKILFTLLIEYRISATEQNYSRNLNRKYVRRYSHFLSVIF